jgi:hypothetical protein
MSAKQVSTSLSGKKSSSAPLLSTGAKFTLSVAGSKGISTVALLSRVWPSADVGIYVDIPVSGTPQSRMLVGRYGVYAIEKAALKLYRTADYGVFNPRMGKDGVCAIEVRHNTASDGAPTNVRVELTAKSHKVGQVLGNLLSKAQFTPPAADLHTPILACFPRDVGVLHWVAQKFYETLNNHARIALVGGKRTSIKSVVKEKFE